MREVSTWSVQKWDKRYLELARLVSTWSKDPSTQTGAVIVSPNNRVIALGFNGFPPGVDDDYRLKDRSQKYEIIVHCEVNAILTAARPLDSYTLYTYPFLSCSRCASIVIQAGITDVIAPKNTIERWEDNLKISRGLFKEAGVEVAEVDYQ